MADLCDINIEDPRWQVLELGVLATKAFGCTLQHLGLGLAGFEISLLGCDDGRIAVLNGTFRDKSRATNVLSWPSEERGASTPGTAPARPVPGTAAWPETLGDIAISYGTTAREAEAAGIFMADHTTHLLVHALLHLLGYDHIDDGDAALMEQLETDVLADMDLSDPYARAPNITDATVINTTVINTTILRPTSDFEKNGKGK